MYVVVLETVVLEYEGKSAIAMQVRGPFRNETEAFRYVELACQEDELDGWNAITVLGPFLDCTFVEAVKYCESKLQIELGGWDSIEVRCPFLSR